MSVKTERIVTIPFGPEGELDFQLKVYRHFTEVDGLFMRQDAAEAYVKEHVLRSARFDHLAHLPPVVSWHGSVDDPPWYCIATLRGVTVDDPDLLVRAQAWVDAHAEELTDAS